MPWKYGINECEINNPNERHLFYWRWKKREKVEPDVVLFLTDSATMVSNSHGFYLKQFLKYKINQ